MFMALLASSMASSIFPRESRAEERARRNGTHSSPSRLDSDFRKRTPMNWKSALGSVATAKKKECPVFFFALLFLPLTHLVALCYNSAVIVSPQSLLNFRDLCHEVEDDGRDTSREVKKMCLKFGKEDENKSSRRSSSDPGKTSHSLSALSTLNLNYGWGKVRIRVRKSDDMTMTQNL